MQNNIQSKTSFLPLLKPEERAIFELRALYQKYGYRQFKMGKFEEYDLYVKNKDFLVSDGIITFTDTNGRLMALKPDVTLSIIKNSPDIPGNIHKVYYNENVYRLSSTRHFKEIMQTGLECIGDIDIYCMCEVIMLAAESLKAVSEDYILDISHLGIISAITEEMGFDSAETSELIRCLGEKNADGIEKLANGRDTHAIRLLVNAYGDPRKVIFALRSQLSGKSLKSLDELEEIVDILETNGYSDRIRLDFSILNDMNYYNGVVFRGYINGIPSGVLSGGQYDRLMQKMGRKSGAIGFALYLDLLERLNSEKTAFDVDTVLVYDEGCDMKALSKAMHKLIQEGRTVIAQKSIPEKMRFRTLLKFDEGRLEPIENHD